MQEEYLALRWKLLKHRKNVIESRTKKFEKFVANLAEAFGDKATIILIGSRARRTAKTYSDFDLLIIYKDLKEEEVYAVVRNFKSMNLPIYFLPIRIEDFNPNDKLLKEMLKEMRILHDGIKLFYENKL